MGEIDKTKPYAIPNGRGGYTVVNPDGTVEHNIGISDGGGGMIQILGQGQLPPVLGGVRGPNDPGAAIESSLKHGMNVANNMFNPFQMIQQSFDDTTPEGRQLRASARKAGYVVILVALLLLFVYLTFKD